MEPTPSTDTETPATPIKAMRRQPCPCGSGKVFKNCHEGAPGYEVATDPTTAVAAPAAKAAAGAKGPAQKPFQNRAEQFAGQQRKGGSTHRQRKV